ncbi:hypothetical protein GCK32_014961 [Trichostrongylus colubriformis]|uniref:Uncharacterized protein n=1 Tax=Trichostrongylus colubriformis TaxID=6319 RepID=A0AAN8FU26_TRICO
MKAQKTLLENLKALSRKEEMEVKQYSIR